MFIFQMKIIYKIYIQGILPFMLLISGTLGEEDLLSELECEVDPLGYLVPDPSYCDRHLICEPNGEKRIVLCESGNNFDFDTTNCAPEKEVNCGDRRQTWRSRDDEIQALVRAVEAREEISRRPFRFVDLPEANVKQEEFSKPTEEVLSSIFSVQDPVLAMLKSRPRPSSTTTTTPSTSSSRTPASSKSSKLTVRVPDDPLADVSCEDGDAYVVPDPEHCDRFLSCPRGHIELCDPGLVLDTGTGFCLLRSLVTCGQRELNFRDNQEELERRLAMKIRALKAETRARGGRVVPEMIKERDDDAMSKMSTKFPDAKHDHDQVQETLGLLISQAKRSQKMRRPVVDIQREEAEVHHHHHHQEEHEDDDDDDVVKLSEEDMERLVQEIRQQILREYNLLKRK